MMGLSMRGISLAVAGGMAMMVAACTSAPVQTYPDVTWRHLSPIEFSAGPVEKVAAYGVPAANDLQPDLPFDLGRMAMNWPDDRLETAGTNDILRYSVTDASITTASLETKGGIKGMFTDDQSQKVDLKVGAKLELLTEDGTQKGEVAAVVERSRTLSESMSVAEREKAIYDETAALLMDLDRELDKQIHKNLGRFLLN
ncbi:hypothetical protein [Thalassospira marina]|uniref:Uncharacterized protein n=1 Tax=Thalassospira marina TaxID=2048283 RepID=A0A2N3KSY7_9PROT|nr:hypothetical protein [Thalassospira marina]AUG51313.1 hypothetical protein CSC3H3_00205 [Thalassospira marina]PKR53630.1 hypothetical protein COO20_13950 [Thalassospira marina]